MVPFAPPAIQGLSVFGGFQFEVLDQTGGDIAGLAEATAAVARQGNESGRVAGLFSSFRADDPQLVVDIDRDKARALGLPLREVTDALQIFLGSQYINDFDFNSRAYRVYAQADQRFRASPDNLKQLYARTTNGQMVSLDTVVRVSETTAPQVISHFNLFRSAEITGVAAPGLSSGEALQAMEEIAAAALPPGFTFAWAGQSLEEISAGSQSVYIFALSVLLVYLVLAAQYESWVLPVIILLGVPLAVLGGLGAQYMRGLANDVFCQVGLVLLVGLAAKNAILIVEFAEQLRAGGHSIIDAAVEASRIRLRPILMTSIAFILGVLPLAYATGAGAAARNRPGNDRGGRARLHVPVHRVHSGSLCPHPNPGPRHTASQRRSTGGGAWVAWAGAGPRSGCRSSRCWSLRRRRKPGRRNRCRSRTRCSGRLRPIPRWSEPPRRCARPRRCWPRRVRRRDRTVDGSVVTTVLDGDRGFSGQSSHRRPKCSSPARRPCRCWRWPSGRPAPRRPRRVDIANLAVDDIRRQVGVATAEAYLAIVGAKRQVEVNERARDNAQAQLDYATARREGGVGSRLNELRAAQELAVVQELVERARLAVSLGQEALGLLIRSRSPGRPVGEPGLEMPVAEGEAWLLDRTDIRLFDARIDLAGQVVADSWRDWVPTVRASFEPSYLTPSGLFAPSGTWRALLTAAVPIFDGGQRRAVKAAREVEVSLARVERREAELQAKSGVRAARASIDAEVRALERAREAADHPAEVLRITDIAFRAGATTNIELVDAQRRSRDAETSVRQAEDRGRLARLALLVALGRFPG